MSWWGGREDPHPGQLGAASQYGGMQTWSLRCPHLQAPQEGPVSLKVATFLLQKTPCTGAGCSTKYLNCI